jgi:hypothetical protein
VNFIGIDLDGDLVNVAAFNKSKDLIHTKSLDINELQLSNVKLLYISKKTLIISCLDVQDILIKNTSFEIKKSFFTKKAIKFQKDLITTIDPSKSICISLYLKDSSKLKFFITTKELLKTHLNRLKNINIDPDYVICSAIALCRFANHYHKNVKNAFLVHISQNKTSCIFMKDNMPEKTSHIKIGLKRLNSDYFENKKPKKTPINVQSLPKTNKLYITLLTLKKEIEKTFISFVNKEKTKYPLILTGNIDSYINLYNFLLNEKTTAIISDDFLLEQAPQKKAFAISIGLALSLFTKEANKLQFRVEEFTPNKTLINLGKKIFFLCFFTIVTFCLVHLISTHTLKQKENLLKNKIIDLEKLENTQLNKKNKIIVKNLYDDLDEYEKKLLKETKKFPYFLKVPNVTETLSWLNNHEYLQNAEVISFNYELEKHPNIYSKSEPYIAKIEIEFKTKIPAIARSFYDSLIKGEGLVNPNETINWEVGNNYYKTSFYLKNKGL